MRNVISIETARAVERAIAEASAGNEGRWNIPRQRIAQALADPAANIGYSERFYRLLDARWAVTGGNADAADSVRKALGAPIVLTHKPRGVVSDLGDLSVYGWSHGIAAALLEDRWQFTRDDPYRYLWRAARGILWNRMREEDRKITRLYARRLLEENLRVTRSVRRFELQRDLEKHLQPMRKRMPELFRLLKAYAMAADEHGEVDRTLVSRRYGVAESGLDAVLRSLERRCGPELDDLWQHLGGYTIDKRQVEHDYRGDRYFSPPRKKLA